MKALEGEKLSIIILVLMGWTGFSLADATTKHLSQTYHPSSILLFGGTVSFICLVLWIYTQRGLKGFYSERWKWLLVRGACIAVTATGVVNALALLPIADVYGITFSAPFMIAIMAMIFLNEAIGLHRWLSIIIGFIGVIVLVGPQFDEVNTGILYAVAATLSIAIGTIIIRKVGKDVYLPLFILYPYLGILAVNIPLGMPHFSMPAGSDLVLFFANAIFVLVAQFLITYAIANARSTASLAPFVYVQVIWGMLFGYLFFNTIPTWTTFVGLTLIVGAGLYMILRERKLNKISEARSVR